MWPSFETTILIGVLDDLVSFLHRYPDWQPRFPGVQLMTFLLDLPRSAQEILIQFLSFWDSTFKQ